MNNDIPYNDLRQYTGYYKKDIRSRIYRFRSGESRLSRLCDFENITLNRINNINECCINDRNNLKNLIIENERRVVYTSEGLVETYPTKKFIYYVQDLISKNVDTDLLNLTFADMFSDIEAGNH